MITFEDLCNRSGQTPEEVREIIKGKWRFNKFGQVEKVDNETAA